MEDLTPAEPKSMKSVGYIYVIEDVQRGLVKIRKSVDPVARISNIVNISGITKIKQFISHRIAGYSQVEHRMHVIFTDHRVRGEWFRCDFEEAKSALISILPAEITEEEVVETRKRDMERSASALETMREKFSGSSTDIRRTPMDWTLEFLSSAHQFVLAQQKLYGDVRALGRLGVVYEGYLELFAALEDCISIAQEINEEEAIASLTKYERACFIDKARKAAEYI